MHRCIMPPSLLVRALPRVFFYRKCSPCGQPSLHSRILGLPFIPDFWRKKKPLFKHIFGKPFARSKKRGVVEQLSQPGSLHKNPIDQSILWGQFIWSKVHPVSPWSTIVELVINWTWVSCPGVCIKAGAAWEREQGNEWLGAARSSNAEQQSRFWKSVNSPKIGSWLDTAAAENPFTDTLITATSKYPHLPLKITVNFVWNIIIRHDAWLPMKSRYFWKFTCCYWHRRAVL